MSLRTGFCIDESHLNFRSILTQAQICLYQPCGINTCVHVCAKAYMSVTMPYVNISHRLLQRKQAICRWQAAGSVYQDNPVAKQKLIFNSDLFKLLLVSNTLLFFLVTKHWPTNSNLIIEKCYLFLIFVQFAPSIIFGRFSKPNSSML